jgi:hypothetical protein
MFHEFYKRYERWWPAAFFVLGFVYDVWSLGRIDSLAGILRQTGFLALLALLLGLEILVAHGRVVISERISKLWKYHELLAHFLLGSLLSEYTLFFFKSSSLWSSFLFIGILGLVLVLNEFKRFQGNSAVPARVTLFLICVVSYFAYMVPLILGFIGTLTFLLSLSLSAGLCAAGLRWLGRKLALTEPQARKSFHLQLTLPLVAVIAGFALLYFTRLIPPIPLAVHYMGIFRELKKEAGQYVLGYERAGAVFWQPGEQTFFMRPGDRPICFVRVFSPNRFKDSIQMRWLLKDPTKGWTTTDTIPFSISGGRAEGFRGYTTKSNLQPGQWQVRTETLDGRELGRVYFKIEVAGDEFIPNLEYVIQ